jgi:hypothetical protein
MSDDGLQTIASFQTKWRGAAYSRDCYSSVERIVQFGPAPAYFIFITHTSFSLCGLHLHSCFKMLDTLGRNLFVNLSGDVRQRVDDTRGKNFVPQGLQLLSTTGNTTRKDEEKFKGKYSRAGRRKHRAEGTEAK